MDRIIARFAENRVFANLAMLIILLAGIAAGFIMVREDLPNMQQDVLSIEVAWPGADPLEVEEGIGRKIEEVLEGLEGIKSYTTRALEGQANVDIVVAQGWDADKLLEKVRTHVSAISGFPEEAMPPIIDRPLHREAVMVLTLGADISERRLKEWAQATREELRRLEGVSQVTLVGIRPYEIGVEVTEENLRRYGLTFAEVTAAIHGSNLNLAGGTIRGQGEEIRVRTVGRKETADSLAAIAVRAGLGGESVHLGELADIRDGFADEIVQTWVDGRPGVLVTVFKTDREDAIQIADAVRDYVNTQQEHLPPGADMSIVYDASEAVRARIAILLKNGLYGLIIVAFLLWLFLDVRLAFWVSMGIPISLAGCLALLWFLGESLNMVSLFSMIMVLGIVADDAIVVGEAIFHHRRKSKSPLAAAVAGVREVGLPVVLAIFTSIMAFLPLAFMEGMLGKFIAILPVTAITCLLISLVECLVLLPAHLNHKTSSAAGRTGRLGDLQRALIRIPGVVRRHLDQLASRFYRPIVMATLPWRYLWLCGTISLLLASAGLITGGILKVEVLPYRDGDVVTATVLFPEGTDAARTHQALNQLQEALARVEREMQTDTGEPLVMHTLTMVGLSADDEVGDAEEVGGHGGSLQVILLPSSERGIHTADILARWKAETPPIIGARSVVYFGKEEGAQGDPIQVQAAGRDMGAILMAVDEIMARLRKFDGVYQVRSDHAPTKKELRLRLKPEARHLGITVADLAAKLHNGYFGDEVVSLQRGRDEVKIRLRYTRSERRNLASVDAMRIPTPEGQMVPLASIAHMNLVPGAVAIVRRDGRRVVTVSAAVNTARVRADEITSELERSFLDEMATRHPTVTMELSGDEEEEGDAFGSLIFGFPLALLGIYLLVATFFRSYVQPLIILLAIPCGIIGAILGHLFLGKSLSLLSIFGMVALTGVVVNDAILIISRINQYLDAGRDLTAAVVSGGVRRFRAVVLTSLTTLGGLMPLLMESSLHAQLLIPMALSLAAGLLAATLATLVLVPCLMLILNDLRRLAARLQTGHWATREAVEPRHQADPPAARVPGTVATPLPGE